MVTTDTAGSYPYGNALFHVPIPMAKHGPSEPCGVEGAWDNRGEGAGLVLLSIFVTRLTSPFLAKKGTEKYSCYRNSPTTLLQAQHASCRLLQGEWEFELVILLFSVVTAALSICGFSSRTHTREHLWIALE